MYKICIIGIYFGKFPSYFNLWLTSCAYNNSIDFLVITDQYIDNLPANVKVINMSFYDFRNLVQSKFDFKISLERPYKICDFKPAFGIICDNFLHGYDFWGHCDFDMIFGDLRKFLTEDILNSYDKILTLGHLSLYRNTRENNNRFKLKGSLVGDYKKVFATDKGFAFDETNGIYQIYMYNNIPVYDKRIFADISSIYKRFRLAQNDVNYKYQVFSFNNGKVFREYLFNNKYYKDEFIYIHIKKPKDLKINFDYKSINNYYITNTGFYPKLNDTQLQDIKKYNNYPGILYEIYENMRFIINRKIRNFTKKVRKRK